VKIGKDAGMMLLRDIALAEKQLVRQSQFFIYSNTER
jgi:hypothetical protein